MNFFEHYVSEICETGETNQALYGTNQALMKLPGTIMHN